MDPFDYYNSEEYQDYQRRESALGHAVRAYGEKWTSEQVVAAAVQFYNFLTVGADEVQD